ncbi:putative JmjC domain-containing protein [Plasmopara halstedii]
MNDPMYLKDVANQCVKPKQLLKFNPQSIHLLNSFASHRNTLVDIACKQRSSDCYHGSEHAKQSVELKFGDFVDYYQASYRNESHWLQTVDDLDFYLAQCTIAVSKPDAKAILPDIMEDINLPKYLKDKHISQVNLWMTVHASRTTLHYDAYHNILVVLYGRKFVTLYPPSDSQKLYPFPLHSKSVNHSQVNIVQPDIKKHPQFLKASAKQFEIKAGDALMIPEGWWHQVDSDEFTIATNYWWNGMREQLVADKRMVPYYARVMLEEFLTQQCESRLHEIHFLSVSQSGYNFNDENSATAAFCAANDQATRERVLMSLESKVLIKTQHHLATRFAEEWRKLLVNASVDLVARLAKCWENDNVAPEFLNVIFRAFDKDEETIKEELVAKHAQFRQLCATQMYQSLSG